MAEKQIASYAVHVLPAEKGGYAAAAPALESCASEGETVEEDERNIREATTLCLEWLHAQGLPIPEDRETVLKRVTVDLRPASP